MDRDSFQSLIELIRDERGAVAWVGAGMSIAAGYPSLATMAREVANRCEALSGQSFLDSISGTDLLNVVLSRCKSERTQLLSRHFGQYPPLEHHFHLVRLPWLGIITTNYDELLEDACKAQPSRQYAIRVIQSNLDDPPGGRLEIYKPHGTVTDLDNIVLEDETYDNYGQRYPRAVARIELMLATYRKVFVGCSMRDRRILDWLRKLGSQDRERLPISAVIITQKDWEAVPPIDRELLESARIFPRFVQRHDDIPALIADLYAAFRRGSSLYSFADSDANEDREAVQAALSAVSALSRAGRLTPGSLQAFANARESIKRVLSTKRLHDLLHHVKSEIYDKVIESLSRDLTRDGRAIQSIGQLRKPLETLISKIRAISNRYDDLVDPLWIESLENAKGALERAARELIKAPNSAAGELALDARDEINEVLGKAPADVNNKLRSGIKELGLGKLAAAFMEDAAAVGDEEFETILPPAVSPEPVLEREAGRFRIPPALPGPITKGAAALGRIEARLMKLASYHSRFQTVFDYLRSTDLRIERESLERKIRAWDRLKEKMEFVYPAMGYEARRDFLETERLVERAIGEARTAQRVAAQSIGMGDSERDKVDFEDRVQEFLFQYSAYRTQADQEFNDLDGMLLNRCEDLDQIDYRLNELLREAVHGRSASART